MMKGNKGSENTATVTLDKPLQRGTQSVTEIVVRKPNSGALRGTRLQALMDLDVDSMMVILPRVTAPAVTRDELLVMEPGDLIMLSVEVVSFLLPKSVKPDFPQS
ncbi:phage tail assembly protein [Citrobacter portucalensis]|uniref:phage tail assembly protein n=1 Tax=Citrobacter portucalensis TaxID=1639133 RepID=UPI00226BB175|nr:phage tail assembly protein [Citrobacter portucalensis]MCX9039102.1 phage tail assembly protein [Citrobacter portucalensis]